MKYSLLIIIYLAFAKANLCQAQQLPPKSEGEKRIEKAAFPAAAIPWIDVIAQGRKIKYYQEYNADNLSFEAKFKFKRHRYSMEFSKDGTLEDVEIEVRKKNIEKSVLDLIKARLDQEAQRWRIEKIQLQFVPNTNNLTELQASIKSGDYQYIEMVVAFKADRKIYRREFLFTRDGTITQERGIKKIAYDFLLF